MELKATALEISFPHPRTIPKNTTSHSQMANSEQFGYRGWSKLTG